MKSAGIRTGEEVSSLETSPGIAFAGELPRLKFHESSMSLTFQIAGSVFDATAAEQQEIRILFGILRDIRLVIKQAIPLRVFKYEGDSIIASWDELQEFGYGETLSAALDDFSRTISELYFFLESESERLGSDLKRVRIVLRKYIGLRK